MSFADQIQTDSCCLNIILWIVFFFGAIKVVTFTLRYSSLIFDLFVLPPVQFKKYGAKTGAYAVITGASDGIGKEYAAQLAQRGFNLVLISRTLSKLETIQKEFQAKYNVKVEVLPIDVAKDSKENYTSIKEICSDLPISILVNNVGRSHSIPVSFLDTTEEEMRNIITINNTATLMITQIITPMIIKTLQSKKGYIEKGLILTMGSFGGLIPTPLLATYSGSKSFLQAWSNSIAGELKSSNIDVQLINSYLVTSAMSKIRRTSMMIPNPRQFVKTTLNSVGRRGGSQDRYATMTPYWSHALYQFFIEESIGVYSKIVNSINYKMHLQIRQRALKKAARAAKKN